MTLLLSAATLHALTACAVTRRTRELGIRRALGARSGRLAVTTARRTAAQLGAGVVLRGGLTFGLLHVATWVPWRMGGWSPWALLVVAILLAGSVFAALLGPLARALSIRPADALRYE